MAYNHYILVCGGTGCESSDADGIYNNFIAEAKAAGLLDKVQIASDIITFGRVAYDGGLTALVRAPHHMAAAFSAYD